MDRYDYVSCMKRGNVIKKPTIKWNEPQHALLGDQYFLHAWGPAYVLSAHIAAAVTSIPPELLRAFANEDVTVGSWMLALNARHNDDRRLCHTQCADNSIAVFDIPKCSGFCDPVASFDATSKDPKCVDDGHNYGSAGVDDELGDKLLPSHLRRDSVGVHIEHEHSLADLLPND